MLILEMGVVVRSDRDRLPGRVLPRGRAGAGRAADDGMQKGLSGPGDQARQDNFLEGGAGGDYD
jgi:hypothetical protein